jgi:NADH:ubiquinone oxidoreductase subunit 5 (subunit L)/multisubunit Na+/H+ antiporter MnhA subunit
MLYVAMPTVPAKIATVLKPFYALSQGKFFLDEILLVLVVFPLRAIAWLSTLFDRLVIDGLIDGVARVPRTLSDRLKGLQGGPVTAYAGVMWIGMVAAVVLAMTLL